MNINNFTLNLAGLQLPESKLQLATNGTKANLDSDIFVASDEKLSWLRETLEWQNDTNDEHEFMNKLKGDLFEDEVFVFTPKGDIKSLPAGSTPIDLAYKIHEQVGHKMVGAKVNSKIVPITTKLANGDIVEIVTSDNSKGPSRDWLKIVKTVQARNKIQNWFKKAQKEENIVKGKEAIEKELKRMSEEIESIRKHIEEIDTARDLLKEDISEHDKKVNEASISLNTAKINLDSIDEAKNQSKKAYESLKQENEEIENELSNIKNEQKRIAEELEESVKTEKELNDNIATLQEELDKHTYNETAATRNMSEAQIDEANARQQVGFVDENINRLQADIDKCNKDLENLDEQTAKAKEDAIKKEQDIADIKATIGSADKDFAKLEEDLKKHIADKESMNEKYKNFFEQIGEVTDRIANLDKELIKLDSNREKLTETLEHQNNYMWEEYELTHHNALNLRDESLNNLSEIKSSIKSIKDEIRGMGNVNVNAIDEYKEVSERYNFLKEQHDDLVKAEADLVSIIEDLDTGMREQFTKGFADIQREFDKAFKELFGGGKGTLELMEDEDILETGIKIIAQPPGKKLQNMMQLSGGEKSLTAIALLFAIQNLKPSPFCLLDEIEAALDDSNVGRFAQYLHKLTKNTQFIIITHRRGTMNAADRLYGITMQEKGVSTLVSVNLIEDDLD